MPRRRRPAVTPSWGRSVWDELECNGYTMKNLLVATVTILLFSLGAPSRTWAGYDEGVAAYERGDYATALREFRQDANQGHAVAQRFLGGMYLFGRGVPQDNTEAAHWYEKAAENGNAEAQHRLGDMYSRGRGVRQDTVVAHKWFILSAARGHARSVKWRDATAKHMSPVQVAEAQRLAREWMAKFEARGKKK